LLGLDLVCKQSYHLYSLCLRFSIVKFVEFIRILSVAMVCSLCVNFPRLCVPELAFPLFITHLDRSQCGAILAGATLSAFLHVVQ
jgi:hypothetical protein